MDDCSENSITKTQDFNKILEDYAYEFNMKLNNIINMMASLKKNFENKMKQLKAKEKLNCQKSDDIKKESNKTNNTNEIKVNNTTNNKNGNNKNNKMLNKLIHNKNKSMFLSGKNNNSLLSPKNNIMKYKSINRTIFDNINKNNSNNSFYNNIKKRKYNLSFRIEKKNSKEILTTAFTYTKTKTLPILPNNKKNDKIEFVQNKTTIDNKEKPEKNKNKKNKKTKNILNNNEGKLNSIKNDISLIIIKNNNTIKESKKDVEPNKKENDSYVENKENNEKNIKLNDGLVVNNIGNNGIKYSFPSLTAQVSLYLLNEDKDKEIINNKSKINNICIKCLYNLCLLSYDENEKTSQLYEQIMKHYGFKSLKELIINNIYINFYKNYKNKYEKSKHFIKQFIKLFDENNEEFECLWKKEKQGLGIIAINLIETKKFLNIVNNF